MKKSTVMLWAIFGALLMGCSDEEIANVETSSRNAIGFNVLSNAAETRAIPTTPDNLTSTDFDVFAFTTDGTAFMGKVDTDFGHDGVKIVYKNGKWDYDNASDLRYWAETTSPAADSSLGIKPLSMNMRRSSSGLRLLSGELMTSRGIIPRSIASSRRRL